MKQLLYLSYNDKKGRHRSVSLLNRSFSKMYLLGDPHTLFGPFSCFRETGVLTVDCQHFICKNLIGNTFTICF